MTQSQQLDHMALEHSAQANFGLRVDVHDIIVHEVAVSPTARASVYLTSKKQLYCAIHANSRLTLGDVQKIIVRMGMRAELYLPPKGHPDYFSELGREKFREVFPGRGIVTDADIAFYRTLAPYNPALIQIQEIKDGVIYQYDSDARTGWRPSAKFAYRRIRTS